MSLIILNSVNLSFGDRDILTGVDLNLTADSKIALTGANGSGKSTLMKIIASIIPPDKGSVTTIKGARTTYLPQDGITHRGKTLYEEAELGLGHIGPWLDEKTEVEEKLAQLGPKDPEVGELVHKQHHLQEKVEKSGWYDRKRNIEEMVFGLGFGKNDLSKKTETFSSGWQMRIALIKTLLSRPDVLLLDEPTNYLDLEARGWLEQFLQKYPSCFVIVSHDRHFLDTTVNKIAELFMGTVKVYTGNYTEYEKRRKQELLELFQRYEKQQEEIEKTEDFISRFRFNASKAKQVQSRIKYLEKLKPIELPEHLKSAEISFPPPERTGDIVLDIEGLGKSYNQIPVFSEADITVERGEKVGIVGANGAGKTTLLRIIGGKDTDYQGTVRYGTKVKIGYYAEELLRDLKGESTIIELLEAEAPTHLIPKLRNYLGSFLFRGDDIYKQTSILSGGETSRLALLRIILHPVNLLVLDEPTNHLDLHTKDILLQGLKSYEGTVVFVSHDRFFLEKLADKIVALKDGECTVYPGGYDYYLWKTGATVDGTEKGDQQISAARTGQPKGKLQYEEAKKIKREQEKKRREEEALLKEIEAVETDIESLHAWLNDPDVYSDPLKAGETEAALKTAEEKHEALLHRWEKSF